MRSMVYMAQFSLAWFIEKIFRNQKGKPLKLQPFQMVMLDMLWHKKFPMVLASRGAGKTFMLAVYCAVKAILNPGSKIVICGAGFRQAKLVFKYIEQLYNASPVFQETCKDRPKYGSDQAYLQVGLSTITAIPIGDGEKIRGLRATVLVADEFASIPEEIFDIVIKPFTAVHADPAERAMVTAFISKLKRLGASEEIIKNIEDTQDFGNQVVISGTASYKHNHFYRRYQTYKSFIKSEGDFRVLKSALEEQSLNTTGKVSPIPDDDVNRMSKMWSHYAVFQLPYYGLPPGFLDEDTIRSDRAIMPTYRFKMEYEAAFPDDSDGFIRRSWIDEATPNEQDDNIPVPIELYGDPRHTYVMGIDPARWNDNLGVVVLKLTPRGKEVVYCNAWDKTEYNKSAVTIREIVKRFNIQYIAMDSGGGGWAIQEWLCKKQEEVEDGELLWPIREQLENKADLSAPGRNIIEMVNFGGSWTPDAAHNLASNIQQCNILFPYKGDEKNVFEQYALHFGKPNISDYEKERLLQDLWGVDEWEAEKFNVEKKMGAQQQIDECINETCAIMRTVTPGGTERFDLPKLSEQPEGLDMRRRDRFSALMLANYAAKVFQGHGHRSSVPAGTATGPGSNPRRRPIGGGIRRRGAVVY